MLVYHTIFLRYSPAWVFRFSCLKIITFNVPQLSTYDFSTFHTKTGSLENAKDSIRTLQPDSKQTNASVLMALHTVDGRHPAPVKIYETQETKNAISSINWCRISSIYSSTV